MTSPRRRPLGAGRRVVCLLLVGVLAVLLAGCVAEVNGMQSPLPHDYDSVQWRPLNVTTGQPLVVAPGYSAAVENDPATTPDELRERVAELPADIQSAELVEIRIGVRPADEERIDESATISLSSLRQVDFASGEPRLDANETLLEHPLHLLPREGDWVILEDLPDVEAGELLLIEIQPGEESAGRWEYGVTPGRAPYGGWSSYSGPVAEPGVQPDTALAFQTTFEQDSDLAGILDEASDRIGNTLTGDLPFAAGYALAILAVAGGMGYALTRGRRAS